MLKRNINLIVKLLLIIAFIILVAIISVHANKVSVTKDTATEIITAQSGTRKILIASPKLYPEISYAVYYDPEPTEELLLKVQNSISKLERINKTNYTCEAAIAMYDELVRLKDIEAKVSSDLNHYRTWEKEHYYAAKTWEYLMQRGYGEAVASAIIGNMMIETSGGTLDLKPTVYSPSRNYYGLCQWSLKYYPGTKDLPFEYQLDYLIGSMPWEITTFGKNYKNNFNYEDFLLMKDPAEAALAFAKTYERCGPASYKIRQEAAIKAYEYFNLNS